MVLNNFDVNSISTNNDSDFGWVGENISKHTWSKTNREQIIIHGIEAHIRNIHLFGFLILEFPKRQQCTLFITKLIRWIFVITIVLKFKLRSKWNWAVRKDSNKSTNQVQFHQIYSGWSFVQWFASIANSFGLVLHWLDFYRCVWRHRIVSIVLISKHLSPTFFSYDSLIYWTFFGCSFTKSNLFLFFFFTFTLFEIFCIWIVNDPL